MHRMRRPSTREPLDFHSVELLTEWLSWNLSHAELARKIEGLLLERGPALPRQMRRDFGCLLRTLPARLLARCVAMNTEAEEWEEFVEWLRDEVSGADDPNRLFGVSEEDFCAERGPGRA